MHLNIKEKWLILIALTIACLTVLAGNQKRGINGDFRVAIVNDEGIYLRTVSPSRKMINLLDVAKDTQVWIPQGLGWYRAGTLKKLLELENKTELIDKVFFYNFGFVPHVVEYGPVDNWLLNGQVVKRWGIVNYFRFRLIEESMMAKQETVKNELPLMQDFLNEVLPRDFADSDILREDMKVSVYNQSDLGGLAGFVARNLEWSGLTIIGVDNYVGKIDKCIVSYGTRSESFSGFDVISKMFDTCKFEENKEMAETEVEITLGNDFAQMLNYGSYTNN